VFVLKSRRQSEADIENAAGILCEQYLPRVYQYVNFWVNDRQSAEELTLKTLRKVIGSYRNCFTPDNSFSIRVFSAARKEIKDHIRTSPEKPVLLNLSPQEKDVISLKLGAVLDNQRISKILGLSEAGTARIIAASLSRLQAAGPTYIPATWKK
jgi:hypothetical protein